jgi:predicted DNA binding CopG/RHH family protein
MNVMQQLLLMNVEQLLKNFSAYRTFHKSDSVINMRIPHEVLDEIKKIADAQNVPYQSLISSVLFSLVDSDEQKNFAPKL